MLITSGKRVLVKSTLISVVISVLIGMASHFLLTPAIGTLATTLFVISATIIVVAGVSYKMIVAPMQGSLDHISANVLGGVDKLSGGHGFHDKSLREHKGIGERYSEISGIINGFYELAGKLVDNGSRIAIASAEVSFGANSISSKVHDEVEDINGIAESSNRISAIVAEATSSATQASALATETRDASQDGQTAIAAAVKQMQETNSQAQDASTIIANLESKSEEIQKITSVISGIAEQTNLLALNAAIEAARAGEQGRGFAVVADEVRALAGKTATATDEIGTMVHEIGQDVNRAVNTMSSLVGAIEEGTERTEKVGAQLANIFQHSESMQDQVSNIARGAEENYAEVNQISAAINSASSHLIETETSITGVAEQAQSLSEMAESIHAHLMDFGIDTVHSQVFNTAAKAAGEIGAIFEQAITSNQLSESAVFDRNYQPIEGSNPQKYSTQFDRFTDSSFPAIQEPILQENNYMAYAGAVDDNGYFPTHNNIFCQPITGDYDKDIVNNRTKRIFNDPTGIRCGSHTETFLLQTYKRDTGEVMHDLSVPIYVNGRHWGGFRIGYKAEDQ